MRCWRLEDTRGTVIRVECREEYLAALECASVDQDFGPFAEFLAQAVRESLPDVDVNRGVSSRVELPVLLNTRRLVEPLFGALRPCVAQLHTARHCIDR